MLYRPLQFLSLFQLSASIMSVAFNLTSAFFDPTWQGFVLAGVIVVGACCWWYWSHNQGYALHTRIMAVALLAGAILGGTL